MRRFFWFLLGILGGLAGSVALARALIPSRGDETSDELGLVAIANALELQSRAAAFRGGSLRTWMAGVDLDLRGAQLAPAGAHLELTAIASGVAVRVPPEWRVVVEGRGMMQGFAAALEGQDELPPDAPVLTVRALVVGSGVEISNRPGGREPA